MLWEDLEAPIWMGSGTMGAAVVVVVVVAVVVSLVSGGWPFAGVGVALRFRLVLVSARRRAFSGSVR